MNNDLNAEKMPRKNGEWTVGSGGAIANKFGYTGLQDEKALQAQSLLVRGKYCITMGRNSSRLELGRIAYDLKEILGPKQFWPIVTKEWFDNEHVGNRRRMLELSMQMHEFSITKIGRKLPKDIHQDTYLHTMRAVDDVESPKQKKAIINSIYKQREAGTLGSTKVVREKLKRMKKASFDEGDSELQKTLLQREIRGIEKFISERTSAIHHRLKQFFENNSVKKIRQLGLYQELKQLRNELTLASVRQDFNRNIKRKKKRNI